jgi:hypothetical protein
MHPQKLVLLLLPLLVSRHPLASTRQVKIEQQQHFVPLEAKLLNFALGFRMTLWM